ncbi:type II toxin-antitoxin system HicA family toxin [Patescibacteria group bacterium]
MPKLKTISYASLVKKIKKAGYIPIRKSKHIIYFHSEKQITIPIPHRHIKDVPVGLLNKIIKEMKISRNKFNQL